MEARPNRQLKLIWQKLFALQTNLQGKVSISCAFSNTKCSKAQLSTRLSGQAQPPFKSEMRLERIKDAF